MLRRVEWFAEVQDYNSKKWSLLFDTLQVYQFFVIVVSILAIRGPEL